MLLERQRISVTAAIEKLVGLQAQLPVAPYVGLWTRIRDFEREDLTSAIQNRKVIKATLLRATLHLFTTEDYLRFRSVLQSMLTEVWSTIVKEPDPSLDLDKVLREARRFIAESPRTFAEISEMLTKLQPEQAVGPMR